MKKENKEPYNGDHFLHALSSLEIEFIYGPSMVMKHRKLFPTSTNQTDCPEFCDPTSTCPYGCYPYPDFYFFPPPPPPPPTSTNQSQIFSTNGIIIVSVLFSFFLLFSYYLIIVKYRSRQTHLDSDGQDVEFAYENQEAAIDHPIWFIHTVGLQPSVINTITAFKYRRSDVLIEGSECPVCLSEFQEDETLRLLPKCHHAFHIPCIDTWLRSHTNCPLCPAGILSNSWSASNPSASDEQIALNLSHEETQIEYLERNDEVGENRSETERVIGYIGVEDERKEVDGSKDQNCLSLMPEDSESNGELGEKIAETKDEIELPHSNGGGVISVVESQLNRSDSMDFPQSNIVNV